MISAFQYSPQIMCIFPCKHSCGCCHFFSFKGQPSCFTFKLPSIFSCPLENLYPVKCSSPVGGGNAPLSWLADPQQKDQLKPSHLSRLFPTLLQ